MTTIETLAGIRSAPEGSRTGSEAAAGQPGLVPHLFSVVAQSPAALTVALLGTLSTCATAAPAGQQNSLIKTIALPLCRHLALALGTGLLLAVQHASAQVLVSGASVPLDLALEAAREAVRSCEASGYSVSASVVDVAGVERVYLRGDHSTIHTRETAFRKAYTMVTLGPIFAVTTTSALAEKISKTPTGPALGSVSNIMLLAGGVALRAGDETLAALGVGGAPGGALDEACAQAGVARIQERVRALVPMHP